MPIARIAHAGGVGYARPTPEGYALLAGPDASGLRRAAPTGQLVPTAAARLLAPAAPRTVVGMAHNTGLSDRALPPQAFLKPVTTVTGPGTPIPVPADAGRVEAEAELAVVIGRTARELSLGNALGYILGVTVANDVTSRDLQRTDPLWFAAKGQDGWTPLGPWLVTPEELAASGLAVDDLELRLSVDGVTLPPASTAGLARSVAECLVYVTSVLTLRPGDVLLTGAPGATGQIAPGCTVTASIVGIGDLHNPVIAAPSASPEADEEAVA